MMDWLRRLLSPSSVPTPGAIPRAPSDMLGSATLPVATGDKGRLKARGQRNNNWGNIDYHEANQWAGQRGIEPPPFNGGRARFAVFVSPEYSVRAILKLLDNYQRKYDIRTIRGMIDRWAPPNENNTDQYVSFVAGRVGVLPDVAINLADKGIAARLVKAIVQKELGYLPDNADTVIAAGIRLAKL